MACQKASAVPSPGTRVIPGQGMPAECGKLRYGTCKQAYNNLTKWLAFTHDT